MNPTMLTILLLACCSLTFCGCRPGEIRGDDDDDDTTGDDDDTTGDDDDTTGDDDDDDTGDDDDTTEVVDCDNLPELPLSYTTISTIGSEDFAFDFDGNAVIAERWTSNVYLQANGQNPQMVAANIGATSTAGTTVLPDGTVVVADECGPIIRVTPGGAVSVVNYNVSANGITVGDDGYLYGASYWGNPAGLFRIDPDSGDAELIHQNTDPNSYGGYDGVTFSHDYTSIYVNEGEWLWDGQGLVYRLEFEQDGSVVVADSFTPLSEYTSGTLDGMTTDVCGNLYIAVSNLFGGGGPEPCSGSGLFRYSPDGETALVSCFGNNAFTPSVEFGSGVGGWDNKHLYVMDWNGVLYDVDVGVPGRAEPHQ